MLHDTFTFPVSSTAGLKKNMSGSNEYLKGSLVSIFVLAVG